MTLKKLTGKNSKQTELIDENFLFHSYLEEIKNDLTQRLLFGVEI